MRILLLFLLCLAGAHAQEPALRSQPMVQLGVGFMAIGYQGDMTYQNEPYNRIGSGFNITAQFDNYKRISPQLNLGVGQFRGQNRELPAIEGIQPNTFFHTSYLSLDLRLRYRINKLGKFRPHFAPGIGIISFTPKDMEGNSLANNLDSREEGETYGSTTVLLPLNVGFTCKINELASIGLDFTHLVVGSDYLDNVGNLGPKSGNDRLQTLCLTLYLTPSQREHRGRK